MFLGWIALVLCEAITGVEALQPEAVGVPRRLGEYRRRGDEQRLRFDKARKARLALGEADYPIDEEFLSSLRSIGSAAGVALGVDRLVMAIAGANEISSVRA